MLDDSNSYHQCLSLSCHFQERQQFHLEQLRAAEFRARAAAQSQLSKESPQATALTQGFSPQQQQAQPAPSQALPASSQPTNTTTLPNQSQTQTSQ